MLTNTIVKHVVVAFSVCLLYYQQKNICVIIQKIIKHSN